MRERSSDAGSYGSEPGPPGNAEPSRGFGPPRPYQHSTQQVRRAPRAAPSLAWSSACSAPINSEPADNTAGEPRCLPGEAVKPVKPPQNTGYDTPGIQAQTLWNGSKTITRAQRLTHFDHSTHLRTQRLGLGSSGKWTSMSAIRPQTLFTSLKLSTAHK